MAHEEPVKHHPAELTVIVTSAFNLPSGKHGCKASVIFGVGKTKFRTQVVDSVNPQWNERSIVPVEESENSPLVFQVTRKERTLGDVVIPLESIPSRAGAPITAPLQDGGSLVYECWVTKTHKSGIVCSTSHTGLGKKSNRPGKFGSFRGSLRKRSGSDSIRGKSPSSEKHAVTSQEDMNCVVPSSSTAVSPAITPNCKEICLSPNTNNADMNCAMVQPRRGSISKVRGVDEFRKRFSFSKHDQDPRPLLHAAEADLSPRVTGISPRSGSMAGGTVITLRGQNLGTCAEDIKAIMVCGKACDLDEMDYFSPSKLTCTTPSGEVGTGPVEVETNSQGRGKSTVTFSYWDPEQDPVDRVPVYVEEPAAPIAAAPEPNQIAMPSSSFKKKLFGSNNSVVHGSGVDSHIPEDYEKQITMLNSRVEELEGENTRLSEYIGKLVAKIIEIHPEILLAG